MTLPLPLLIATPDGPYSRSPVPLLLPVKLLPGAGTWTPAVCDRPARQYFSNFDLAKIRQEATLAVQAFGNVDGVVLWLRHISKETPGAVPGAAWEATRQQVIATSDGTFGRGWQAADSKGNLHYGYQAAVLLKAGIWRDTTAEILTPEGLLVYRGAMLIYTPPQPPLPPIVSKYDVLIAADGVRFCVGDSLRIAQAFGADILRYSALEQRSSSDLIYKIGLT